MQINVGACFRLVYAPVNIMPHYPLPGYVGENVGHFDLLDTKICWNLTTNHIRVQ